jgi:hypothetical protein
MAIDSESGPPRTLVRPAAWVFLLLFYEKYGLKARKFFETARGLKKIAHFCLIESLIKIELFIQKWLHYL